ncbi:MAG: hypothetical protein GY719_07120 [bacterium]|nr:hypothetical protein [bacterium]
MTHDRRTDDRDSDRKMIALADHQIQLPPGLTITDWNIEKVRWQNPRIRTFLGCIRLLGGVLESNYAILHCSPERLQDIWRKVRQVGEVIRTEMAPLLRSPSRFPALEEARQRAELSLDMLTDSVLTDLERFTAEVAGDQLIKVRKLLCVSIGKMHAFLQDAFGEIMANDPRSFHDADYFLSKRFPQDLEEAEWLHATVSRMLRYLESRKNARSRRLGTIAADIAREQTLPVGQTWEEATLFLHELVEVLTPKLKEVLALRGIRFYEMEILDRYAMQIPTQCQVLIELHATGRLAVEKMKTTHPETLGEREQNVRDLESCHASISARITTLMREIDTELQDLNAFVPIWLDGITKRRALLLKSTLGKKDEPAPAHGGR